MTATEGSASYRFARFELQPAERRLLRDGVAVTLRPLAFDVLKTLVEHAGHLVTKDALIERVWGKVVVEENSLQALVSALRKVLGADAIATVSGQGYRLTLEAAPAREPPSHNLPQALTRFIGREPEIAQVKQWLATTRLLTLSGAGGCGKTRLALQVAGALHHDYPDGVWLVELAPLGDPTLVVRTVANALGVKEQAGQELVQTLADWLGERRLLLVLDNAEHLLEACASLADRLLARCAGLAILVTSRERLGLAGEMTYRVPSLSMPLSEAGDDVLGCDAVRLFIDRARLQRPDFDVTAIDAKPLASICRRLDGIALAIELAAPRVRVMSLEELSRRLDDRFNLLTGGSRNALPRHRTLRSLVDWSHELLSENEKVMLRRLAVFAGGCTLDSAERVCSGNGIARADVLDLLTSLADKNLVVAETQDGDTRFRFLETVRHYAQERLSESGEEQAMRERHIELFLDMANGLAADRNDESFRRLLKQFDPELDNLRAALLWCEAAPHRAMTGVRLAGNLFWFWRMRSRFDEGRGWIVRLLAAAADTPREEAHAEAITAAAGLAKLQGDSAAALALYQDALEAHVHTGNRKKIAWSLASLGAALSNQGDLAAAREHYAQAMSMAREVGDKPLAARLQQVLGFTALEAGDYAAAAEQLQACLANSHESGRLHNSLSMRWLGDVRHAQGDLVAARTLQLESLSVVREFEDMDQCARTLMALACVANDSGDFATARAELEEAHELLPPGAAHAEWLDAFAGMSPVFANAACAARLWGCVERLRKEQRYPRSVPERARHERWVAAARNALQDDSAFDRAWAEGLAWSQDEAVRYAQSL